MKAITLTTFLIITFLQISAQNWEHYYGDNDKKESSSDILEAYDDGYMLAGRIRYQDDNRKAVNKSKTWEHFYGDNVKYEHSEDILESYDKGFLTGGRILYGTKDWINHGWLIKTDINGNLLWDKKLINNNNSVLLNAIDQCNDGGILICGSLGADIAYPFIAKINFCGEKEWCHRISGSLNAGPWAEDIKELPNGDIIVLVTMFGHNPEETMHLFKFDPNGNYLWDRSYCSGYNHDVLQPLGENFQLTHDNKVIICGSSYWKNPWEPGSDVYWIRPTFTKVNLESGEEEWVLPFGLQDTIVGDAYHFIQKDNGYNIGFASDWTDDIYTHPLFIEFNDNGNLINHKKIHSSELDPSFEESYIDDGFIIDSNFYLIGTGGDMDNDFPMFNVVLDTNVFSNEINIKNISIRESIHWQIFTKQTFDNKIINAAVFKEPGNWDIFLTKLNLGLEQDSIYTSVFTYDSLCPFPITSGFITLDDCFPVGIDDEIPTPKEYNNCFESNPISIFPNPVSELLNVSFENIEFHNDIMLKVYNTHGKLVFEDKIINGQLATEFDVSLWASGFYSIVLTANSNNSIIGIKKFIVK